MQGDKGERLSESVAVAEKQRMKVLGKISGYLYNVTTPRTLDEYRSILG